MEREVDPEKIQERYLSEAERKNLTPSEAMLVGSSALDSETPVPDDKKKTTRYKEKMLRRLGKYSEHE